MASLYELIDYKNLGHNAPPGMYIFPFGSSFHGVLFIHSGMYKEGIFKFALTENQAEFETTIFHPLIKDRILKLPKMCLKDQLFYIRNAFRQSTISSLQTAANEDALLLFRQNKSQFALNAAYCAKVTNHPATLYSASNIQFKELDENMVNGLRNRLEFY